MARVQLQAADWATLIDEWRQSGLSLQAFCQRHGLSRGMMQNWVYKPALKRAVEEARRRRSRRSRRGCSRWPGRHGQRTRRFCHQT
jgi:hypothetical protein